MITNQKTNQKKENNIFKPINWKTSLIGVLTLLFQILESSGLITLPKEVKDAIITIAIFLIGLTAADAR